ncbi:hypothetical protein [Holophaga foetida]|uniref:hypothetical protein n=1 Tax=Holophaga foetida TaxID=35839 RepID=UPI0002474D07|nr:hypothetical protein [Holophaga foetida]
MSNPDPEYLLGGYATGTLTPEEKALLLRTALKDQALFDALMDEEALRELLADPKARKRLLAILPKPRKPLFLRPQIMALAAGLVLAVGVTWMMERGQPAPSVVHSLEPQESRLEAPHSKDALPQAEPGTRRAKAEREPERLAPGSPGSLGKRPDPLAEAPAAIAPASSPAKPVEVELSKSMDAVGELRAPAPAPSPAAKAKRTVLASARPAFRLERNPGGVQVFWSGEGHLYVLKRGPAGVRVLGPRMTRVREDGGLASTFEFTLSGKELVDIYLLRSPVHEPASLLSEAPADGLWRRIEP